MAYQEGDTSPPHTNVHNDVRTQLDQLSTEFEIPVVLPPVVGLGDAGHVNHHNLFTTAIAELSKHECEDGLEGLGDWAEITEVTGSPKRYAYNDGTADWVAFEWSGSGSMTLQADGLLDVLCASTTFGGHPIGGRINRGLVTASSGGHNVKVGLFSDPSLWQEKVSEIAGVMTSGVPVRPLDLNELGGPGAWSSGSGMDAWSGISYDITGNPVLYCHYTGTTPGSFRQNGTVIVRVPAAQAAGVSAGSWVTRIDYYAEVTDGLVTDLYQERFYGDDTVRTENGSYASPEQPDDLIPCDPSVAEGWTYADGEFTPPPPDPSWREEAIAALKQQIKDLQKDAK